MRPSRALGSLLVFAALPLARDQLASQVLPVAKGEVLAKGTFGVFTKQLGGETPSMKDLLTGVAVIEPGQEIHPPHQHPEEEFLLLAKGAGTWNLDGKELEAREGDLLYLAPSILHGLKNTSTAPLTFFVVKWNGVRTAAPAKPLASQLLRRTDVKPEAENSPIGDVRIYLSGGATPSLRDLMAGVVVLNAGQQLHPPHQHPEEQFFYVVKGSGTFTLGGDLGATPDAKELPANEGDLLYAAPSILHGLRNRGQEPLTCFLMKWKGVGAEAPKPADGGR